MKIHTRFGEAELNFKKYSNGRTAIQLLDDEHFVMATLTVNLPDAKLNDDEFAVKVWSENDGISQDAFKSGLFIDTGKRISTGYVIAPVWKLKQVE